MRKREYTHNETIHGFWGILTTLVIDFSHNKEIEGKNGYIILMYKLIILMYKAVSEHNTHLSLHQSNRQCEILYMKY